MAAAAVLPLSVPGLHGPITPAELNKATTAYNLLPPDDDDLPVIPDENREDIQKLIRDHGVEGKFCFHLLHNHAELEPGTVMHGTNLSQIEGSIWSRPTPIDQLDLTNMRGQIFVLDAATGNFGPYEFREGPPEPLSDNDNAFVIAFKDYLFRKGLTKSLGLELLPKTKMVELIFNNNFGTVLMHPKYCKLAQSGETPEGRTTAWGGNATELKGNVVSHQERQNNLPHFFVTDSKRKPWEEDEAFALETLRKYDAIE